MSDPITPQSLAPTAEALITAAAKHGASASDVLVVHGRSSAISVREGALEDIDNSEGRDIGLRVMVGQRQAAVSSSDISSASIEALAERAVAMAKLAPEDPYCGLSGASELSDKRDADGLDLFDGTALTPAQLKVRALEVESAAKAVTGVSQAEGASASTATSASYFMTSGGFAGGWQSSNFGLSVAAIAEKDGAMERDYDHDSQRFLSDLRSPESVGYKAGERTIARLGAKQLPSAAMPIIFDRRVSHALLSAFLGAISGTAIARQVSFLKDKMGKAVFGDHIQIIDDPTRPRGHASRPFDGEGLRAKATTLIDKGVLQTWLLNQSSARQLGLKSTGHARRGLGGAPSVTATNATLLSGTHTPEALRADIEHGLLITEMFGPSLNANTGDYSVGVAGYQIDKGEIGHPVTEVTIAGNLIEIFPTITPANDIVYNRSIVAPSLRCEGLTLAGS